MPSQEKYNKKHELYSDTQTSSLDYVSVPDAVPPANPMRKGDFVSFPFILIGRKYGYLFGNYVFGYNNSQVKCCNN